LTGNKPQSIEELKDRAEFWIRIEGESKACGEPMPVQTEVEDKSGKATSSNSMKQFDSKLQDNVHYRMFTMLTTSTKVY
jgi:hypothetical protein